MCLDRGLTPPSMDASDGEAIETMRFKLIAAPVSTCVHAYMRTCVHADTQLKPKPKRGLSKKTRERKTNDTSYELCLPATTLLYSIHYACHCLSWHSFLCALPCPLSLVRALSLRSCHWLHYRHDRSHLPPRILLPSTINHKALDEFAADQDLQVQDHSSQGKIDAKPLQSFFAMLDKDQASR